MVNERDSDTSKRPYLIGSRASVRQLSNKEMREIFDTKTTRKIEIKKPKLLL
jgi:hypothetical protein